MTIEWEDPPRTRPRRSGQNGVVNSFLTELAAHPGKWARYPSAGSRTYIQLLAGLRGLTVEVRHTGQRTPDSALYVRVVEQ